jgi:hypothetical protein
VNPVSEWRFNDAGTTHVQRLQPRLRTTTVVVRDSTIQCLALRGRQWERVCVGDNARPDFLDQRQGVGDIEVVNAKGLRGCPHVDLLRSLKAQPNSGCSCRGREQQLCSFCSQSV